MKLKTGKIDLRQTSEQWLTMGCDWRGREGAFSNAGNVSLVIGILDRWAHTFVKTHLMVQ